LFVDLNSVSSSASVKMKDKFYVHDAGYDVVISYPFLMVAEKQSLTVQLMTEIRRLESHLKKKKKK